MKETDLKEIGSPLSIRLGKRLRERRIQAGLSQAMLHEKTAVGLSHISRIERGLGNPTLDMMESLAFGVGCKIEDLLRDSAE